MASTTEAGNCTRACRPAPDQANDEAKFVQLPRAVLRDKRLSPEARLLYALILDHAGPRGIFPSEERLAELLGRSARTVQRLICRLEDTGHLTVDRSAKTNRYLPRTLARPCEGYTTLVSPMVSPIPTPHTTPVSPGYTTPVSHEVHLNEVHSSSAAAAASEEQKTEAAATLESAGMPRELAEHCANRDAGLALAVASYMPARLADPKLPPIRNPTGFMRGVFNDPGSYGFERDAAGVWHPPREAQVRTTPNRQSQARLNEMLRERRQAAERDPLATFRAMRTQHRTTGQ